MRTNTWSITFLSLCTLVACGPKSGSSGVVTGGSDGQGSPVASSGSAPARVEVITLDDGRQISIQHGSSKDPGVAGCADGTREAFHDDGAFPRIAGCMASWASAMSLRAPATGRGCGDGIGPCGAPADACAPGWHLCGSNGLADLRQVTGEQCEQAGGGRFSAATSHCRSQSGCEYDGSPNAAYGCFESGWCSEPVCCGADCGEFGQCTGGVWNERTHIPVGTDQGCGMTSSERAGGVLCCR